MARSIVIASSFVLSAADIEPAVLAVAGLMEITGDDPPELTIGRVPVTPMMSPGAPTLNAMLS